MKSITGGVDMYLFSKPEVSAESINPHFNTFIFPSFPTHAWQYPDQLCFAQNPRGNVNRIKLLTIILVAHCVYLSHKQFFLAI